MCTKDISGQVLIDTLDQNSIDTQSTHQHHPFFSMGDIFKASTHEGACSRSTLLQHATGAKLPRSHQRFLTKNMLCNKTFTPKFSSLISNWFDMREQAPGANLLDESVSGASSLVCTEICLL